MRIGELLIGQGHLTPEGLDEALEWQVLYGGRLGTNLLELQLVSEEHLARSLGKQLGCEVAWGNLDVDPALIGLIPKNIAERDEMVPWKVDRRRVKVLVIQIDPGKLDELSYKIGKACMPVVAPEFRVVNLLRAHYGAMRQMRALDFGVAPEEGRRRRKQKDEPAPAAPAPELIDEKAFNEMYNQVLAGKSSPNLPVMAAGQGSAERPAGDAGPAPAPVEPPEAVPPPTAPGSHEVQTPAPARMSAERATVAERVAPPAKVAEPRPLEPWPEEEPKAEPMTHAETEAGAQAGTQAELQTEPGAQAEAETRAEAGAQAEAGPQAEAETPAEAGAQAEAETPAEAGAQAEAPPVAEHKDELTDPVPEREEETEKIRVPAVETPPDVPVIEALPEDAILGEAQPRASVPPPAVPAPILSPPVVPVPTVVTPAVPRPIVSPPVVPVPTVATPRVPTPVVPPPVAPSPVVPPPVVPPPVVPSPVVPPPVAPSPVAPSRVGPTPVPPSPVTSAPVVPHPAAPTSAVPLPAVPPEVVPTSAVPPPVGATSAVQSPVVPPAGVAAATASRRVPSAPLPPTAAPAAPAGSAHWEEPQKAARQVDESPLAFHEALELLRGVENRDSIARIVLRASRSKAARALLLLVQGNVVLGWDGLGEGVEKGAARTVAVSLAAPSVFQLVVKTRSHFLGPLQRTPINIRFLAQIGKKVPLSSMVLPILHHERVSHVLYLDNGHKRQAPTDVGEMLILSQRIGQTVDALVDRRKAALG